MKRLLIALIVLPMIVSCGKNGRNGRNGLNGLGGADGIDGIQGEKGDKGDKGDSTVKVVKFCAGLTDAYGVSYQERGLCVEGKVYAIYSGSSMAALVELSNGLYTTTTPSGVNCTFTVSDDTCAE